MSASTPASMCPILFMRHWARTGLAEAIAAIDASDLATEMRNLKSIAPSRASVGKNYLSDDRNGYPTSSRNSNRLEELTAIAMVNLNRRWPLEGGGYFQLIDYQTPLKARRSDAGIGKIDLLGLTDTGRFAIVELKVVNRSGGIPDSPISAMLEGLCYATLVEANHEALRQEVQDRFGVMASTEPPIILVLAPTSWWRSWHENKAAGNWWPALEALIRQLEKLTGLGILLHAFSMTWRWPSGRRVLRLSSSDLR